MKRPHILNRGKEEDFGFGTPSGRNAGRLIGPDGTFNVKRKGQEYVGGRLYHLMLNLPWLVFVFMVMVLYFFINAIFAGIYIILGPDNLMGMHEGTAFDNFWQYLFFSVHTFTTTGYGRLSPVGWATNIVAALEAMVGLISFAFATGLFFARFSRPKIRVAFSRNALIAPYKEGKALEFRIANAQKNDLVDVKAQVLMTWIIFEGGEYKRLFKGLSLERESLQMFPLNWTVVHPIDKNSPMHGKTKEWLRKNKAEFLVVIKGNEEALSQSIHVNKSYNFDELVWGARFNAMYFSDKEGHTILDLDKINDYTMME